MKNKNMDIPINYTMYNLSLYYIQLILINFGKKMSDFPSMLSILNIDHSMISESESQHDREKYDPTVLKNYFSENLPKMNNEQKILNNKVVNKIDNQDSPGINFIRVSGSYPFYKIF